MNKKAYTMKKVTAPIPFAGSQLGESRHVCAFFNSDDEEYRVLLPFIKDGFECGDKAIHVVNPDQHRDHLKRLADAGIDAETARQNGQLELRTNTETYLRDGRLIRIGCWTRSSSWPPRPPKLACAEPHCLPHGLGGRNRIARRQSG